MNNLNVMAKICSDWAKQFASSIDELIINEIIRNSTKGSAMGDDLIEKTLKEVCLLQLHIRLWQGKKSLKEEDLAANGIDVSKLPPGTLATLGSKKTIDNKATAPFIALKREAISICSKYGVKFGDSGYAIPNDKIEGICRQLSSVKAEFALTKQIFLSEYDSKVEAWIKSNPPEWQEAIRKSVDNIQTVNSAMSFNFSAIGLNPVDNVENGLGEEVLGLYGQLCKEVRQLAKLTFDTSYAGKSEVGQRALRPLKHIKAKLEGMLFLNPTLCNVVNDIHLALTMVGKSSVIKGVELQLLSGLLANKLQFLGIEQPNTVVVEDPEIEEVEPPPRPTGLGWDF